MLPRGQREILITVSVRTATLLRHFAKEGFRTVDAEIEWLVEQERRRCNAEERLTTASTVTAAPVDSAAPNLIEAQPQVKPER